MRCTVLHQQVAPDAPADDQDELTTAASVAAALRRLGWQAEAQPVTLDLAAAADRLRAQNPDLVFNLVDALDGNGPLCAAVPALLAGLGLRFTGAGPAALALTADKPATRRALRHAGLPVPPGPEDGWPGPFIIKHATEHASRGLGRHSVVPALPPLAADCYAEAFLDGPEYNVSLLADGRGGGTVLPVAKLVFAEDWPADMPRILDYAAKWDRAHPLYTRTDRRFVEPEGIAALARDVWHALGLAGYARVDVRLSAEGVPYVIDVNVNPCLGEDAGLAAAAAEAGMDYITLIGRIVQGAMATAGLHRPRPSPNPLPQGEGASKDCSPSPCGRGLGGGARPGAPAVVLRRHLLPADQAAIAALCRATGFFTEPEIAIAEELAADRLARGEASDYRFLLAEQPDGPLLGYACYGHAAATRSAWDLYWIVVHPETQRTGLGRRLLDAVLAEVETAGGTRLYVETEAADLYAPTRAFYAGCGFRLQAVLPDFYAPGRAKQIRMRPVGRDPDTVRA